MYVMLSSSFCGWACSRWSQNIIYTQKEGREKDKKKKKKNFISQYFTFHHVRGVVDVQLNKIMNILSENSSLKFFVEMQPESTQFSLRISKIYAKIIRFLH